jgi:hypothetical protein
MREVSDAFLLNVAEVTAALVGLFLVGVFFFVETGLRHLEEAAEGARHYFRAGVRIVLVLFAIPLFLSLTLVAMDPVWSHLLFLALCAILVAANVDSLRNLPALTRTGTSRALVLNELAGTAAVVPIVLLPWILGGTDPSREDLAWSILLSFGVGFLSVGALVLSAFDLPRGERQEPSAPPNRR